MNRITNNAAPVVVDSGSKIFQKNRSGPAPSTLAASTSSSGTLRKNWRKISVAVADAMSGTVSPGNVFTKPRAEITLNVGMMRTSTRSIQVAKIIQKKNMRRGDSKKTTANADSKGRLN